MAGIMDEYDPPTPVIKAYCSRLSAEEYENEASSCTEDAIAELIQYLEKNPASYRKAMAQKKKEKQEDAGFFSYAKVKLLSLLTGNDSISISEGECKQELHRIADEMVKVFDYSEESKGRRRSKRLAAKNAIKNDTPQIKRSKLLVPLHKSPPPPPPPPPPLAPSHFTPVVENTLSRRPLCPKRPELDIKARGVMSEPRPKAKGIHKVLNELNGPGKKMMLRSTVERSPGGTPCTGWPKISTYEANLGYFNTKLVDKFKNIRSPVLSSLAAPGTFDSPD